ncbi:hypothetical protein AJ79_05099 [Helicocarpus griseus UAMH5409]|uniref:Arf-GAP domain-containing protein n=1 Tax=Helicocarpus griseus UAMH5409 TaxID=1447875 RepID=A0A2B7XRC7_9EURO|nr:hypothetical protein AJ79_05099 [Helicocarpus griseus UAMH5409]
MSSRRAPNPAAERAAKNQAVIKNILKLDCNKTCADCKRNKHPRWASWNIGIFICIRCSGIHRGMGTHISRVKSVDLDTWTDEQLQSVLKWGNARANKYWEAKLAPGHVPSESKMENFIRTKYESKRWVMDGPMPDPSTLDVDEGDDNMPLAIVQEKAKLDRSASQRASSTVSQPAPRRTAAPVSLFDDDTPTPPDRPNTTDLPGIHAPPRPSQPTAAAPAPKPSKPGDSLLGLDFFGSTQPAANRPSSTPSSAGATGPSRPDLKQSILSLYASAPKPQPPAQPQHERNASFGSFSSMQSQPKPQADAFGGLTDAFSGLSFPSTTSPPPQKQDAFSNLGSFSAPKSPPAAPQISSPPLSDGGLFSSPPMKPAAVPKPQQARHPSVSAGRDFDLVGATIGSTKSAAAPPATSTSAFDLFSSPSAAAPKSPPVISPKTDNLNSVFNLSAPQKQPEPAPIPVSQPTSTANVSSMLSTSAIDPWGGNAWTSSEPSLPNNQATSTMMKVPERITANDIGSGWGSSTTSAAAKPAPTVSADEDFGGWTSAPPPAPSTSTTSKPKSAGGFPGSDDLFSNVWE